MKKFLIKTCLFFGGSIVLIIAIYFYTDPFKTIYPFELKNISTVNREYLSVELFKKNYAKHRYNSFILCSSRGCGINTYQWKQYLDKEDNQFLFQAWSETIMGTCRKLNYVNDLGEEIVPKGKKYSKKVLEGIEDYAHLTSAGWTDDKHINGLIDDLLHNYRIRENDLQGMLRRDKFTIAVGDELPAGILKLAKIYVAKKLITTA